MKIFAEPAEAAERLDELIDLVMGDDEVVVCRAGNSIAAILQISQKCQGTWDDVWALAATERRANNDQTLNPDEFYDENGLPK